MVRAPGLALRDGVQPVLQSRVVMPSVRALFSDSRLQRGLLAFGSALEAMLLLEQLLKLEGV